MRLPVACCSELVILLMNLVPALFMGKRAARDRCVIAGAASASFCGWAPCSGTLVRLVTCPSGRRCNTRNVVWCKSQRGFKSHRHRQVERPCFPCKQREAGPFVLPGIKGLPTFCPHSPERLHSGVCETARLRLQGAASRAVARSFPVWSGPPTTAVDVRDPITAAVARMIHAPSWVAPAPRTIEQLHHSCSTASLCEHL